MRGRRTDQRRLGGIGFKRTRLLPSPSVQPVTQYEPTGDALDALCWCQRIVMKTPREWILAGRVRSCGRPGCEATA